MKTFKVKVDDVEVEVYAEVSHYQFDDSLVIQLSRVDTNNCFALITKCIAQIDETPYPFGPDEAFVDIHSYSWAKDFIEKNELGEATGLVGEHNNKKYPCYKFDLGKLID